MNVQDIPEREWDKGLSYVTKNTQPKIENIPHTQRERQRMRLCYKENAQPNSNY